MKIRSVQKTDKDAWLRMRNEFWPGEEELHAKEIDKFFSDSVLWMDEVLVADENGTIAGIAELSIRFYADGCETENVGYLEWWFVNAQYRGNGVGKRLVNAAEDWLREKGCTEFASDTEIDNLKSKAAHEACGFKEVAQIRCFMKMVANSEQSPEALQSNIHIKAIEEADRDDWLRIREEFWPEEEGAHEKDIKRFFEDSLPGTDEVLLATENGKAVGMAELYIRPWAEGCKSDRVAYLEGWWVDAEHRNKGIGKLLVSAAENWAREKGYTEFASDTDLDNEISRLAHLACGFKDVHQIRCFAKKL